MRIDPAVMTQTLGIATGVELDGVDILKPPIGRRIADPDPAEP